MARNTLGIDYVSNFKVSMATAAAAIAQTRISDAIAQNLDELSLANLGLDSLPVALLTQLVDSSLSLRSLDLSGNALTQLPDSIAHLRALQVLSVGENPLEYLPESLGQLTQLRILDISGTRITTLPNSVERLVEMRSLMVIQDPTETTRGQMASPITPPPTASTSGRRTIKGLGTTTIIGSNQPMVESYGKASPMSSAIKAQLSKLPAAQSEAVTRSLFKDWVNASVFSPRQVRRDDSFLVQVFAYLPDQIETVQETAHMVDDTAQQVAKKKLGIQVTRDTDLFFELEMPGVNIDEAVQSLRWQGNEDSVEFGVSVPAEIKKKTLIGTITVSQKSVPIGHLKFRVTIGEEAVAEEPGLVGEDATRYKKAFVSYSSKDRAEVLKRVQGMQAVSSIEVFQDVLNLSPGDRWEKELYKNINECDLFLLFWSTAAKASEWVVKEAEYALALQLKDELQLPAIKPVILEGPPVIPPPEALKHLHFNDIIIYLIDNAKLS
ncbi:MAG: TIR domain-containing protein [Cyanobacteria bacterium P01_A01_bin.116]